MELHRDLSVAFSGQVAQLKAATEGRLDSELALKAFALFDRALLIAEAEASRVERSGAGSGAWGGLDLDAARAEILAKLAVWAAEG
ncbi:MAG TPA: hypothetical protein VFN28_12880 [Amaricoccus sp.]|nr:hypothetical protein [Amaricoccus sp.]